MSHTEKSVEFEQKGRVFVVRFQEVDKGYSYQPTPEQFEQAGFVSRSELESARLENEAWRALASLQDGRYDVAFPARRTLGDFGGSVADRTKREPDGLGGTMPVRVYGEGPTPQAAAIDLARKLGLVPAATGEVVR